MDEKVFRNGIYAFIFAMLLGVLIFKDYRIEGFDVSNSTVKMYEPLRSYILSLVRFAAIITFFIMILTYFSKHYKIINDTSPFLYLLKLLIIGVIIVVIAYLITRLVF